MVLDRDVPRPNEFLDFIAGYREAALWTLDEEIPKEADTSDELEGQLWEDAKSFWAAHHETILRDGVLLNVDFLDCSQAAYAGHDFWLSRNGHGAGFWDGDWRKPEGELLHDAARALGEFDIYLGDDGKLYGG